ncbi:unnamed protein product [Nezara viridula]|uniref:Uncharacterized protein n=1 Tax=Nezara viridula TaxID=85310 RepID=A0A9P0ECR8_NEZVI|nr:unnamed protein product [Nezara viridula]
MTRWIGIPSEESGRFSVHPRRRRSSSVTDVLRSNFPLPKGLSRDPAPFVRQFTEVRQHRRMGFRQPLSFQASEHPSSDSLCPIAVPMAAKDTAWSAGGRSLFRHESYLRVTALPNPRQKEDGSRHTGRIITDIRRCEERDGWIEQADTIYSCGTTIPIIIYKYFPWDYETGNGISVQEEGFLKNPGLEGEEAQTSRGTYSYTAPDGQVITVNWYADETGFHAEGAHIPSTSSPVLGPPVTVGPVRPKPPIEQGESFEALPVRPAAEFFRG